MARSKRDEPQEILANALANGGCKTDFVFDKGTGRMVVRRCPECSLAAFEAVKKQVAQAGQLVFESVLVTVVESSGSDPTPEQPTKEPAVPADHSVEKPAPETQSVPKPDATHEAAEGSACRITIRQKPNGDIEFKQSGNCPEAVFDGLPLEPVKK